eukprot:CAMPEP_0115598790 /NCGR_PEP_ID=MMETSP0272-20121206/14058_1 /TAXON_ID=71861 /ORGANISM="Scrippsiella trochoidea, Strain CCMP3099" /LENGTH=244 /DNA_ID=CAMNT_0003034221 /DNA_START=397 /DNA_END=1128 /DNA_ORIENTATION=-
MMEATSFSSEACKSGKYDKSNIRDKAPNKSIQKKAERKYAAPMDKPCKANSTRKTKKMRVRITSKSRLCDMSTSTQRSGINKAARRQENMRSCKPLFLNASPPYLRATANHQDVLRCGSPNAGGLDTAEQGCFCSKDCMTVALNLATEFEKACAFPHNWPESSSLSVAKRTCCGSSDLTASNLDSATLVVLSLGKAGSHSEVMGDSSVLVLRIVSATRPAVDDSKRPTGPGFTEDLTEPVGEEP